MRTATNSLYLQFDEFFKRWAALLQMITGVVLLVVATVVAIIAVIVFSQASNEATQRHREASEVRLVCERTREFAPAIGADDVRRGVFTAQQARDYFLLIPKSCSTPQ